MSHPYSALALAAAIMGAALVGAVSLPQAAEAQVYGDAGPRPFAMRTQDDVEFDQGRARVDHRQEFGYGPRGQEPYPHHRIAGYDDRYGEPSPDGWRGHRGERPPLDEDERRWDRGDGRPAYGVGFDRPVGPGFPERPYEVEPLEEIAAPVAPQIYDDRRGPDVGCTIQRSESVTAVGWRKIVTHKTCYQR